MSKLIYKQFFVHTAKNKYTKEFYKYVKELSKLNVFFLHPEFDCSQFVRICS